MPRTFTRDLTFQSNDLGKETTIMLTFDADMKGLYEDFFPVVWMVSKFGKTGTYDLQATYTSQLAFSRPQVDDGGYKITEAAVSVKINVGEKTSLTESNDIYYFSTPQPGTPDVLQAVNNTGAIQDIALGFISQGDLVPQSVLCFSGVGDGRQATAQFTPVLRLYITSDYQENAIIRSAITPPAIWSQDLTGLAKSTTWTLKYDAASGHYTLVQSY
ncbi:hypothetical protein BDR04DRAFT_415729 [Suillus decipiens]|nr:hypothetical protein BDR04DRAFT_415729 [Suillus decipiens]